MRSTFKDLVSAPSTKEDGDDAYGPRQEEARRKTKCYMDGVTVWAEPDPNELDVVSVTHSVDKARGLYSTKGDQVKLGDPTDVKSLEKQLTKKAKG